MDYKEKYNELVDAIKVLQEANPSDEGIQNWVNENVPELKESKDEKVRKALIDGFKRYDYLALFNGCYVKDILPWLEKQGRQNPAWTEADDEEFEIAINALKGAGEYDSADWLLTLKQRIL